MFGKKESKAPTEKQKIGQIGEDCACQWLVKNGYSMIERNYLRKWGEIDIIAKKGNKIHFIEVKSVSRPIRSEDTLRALATSNGINEMNDSYRAEDNMHPWKLKRLGRVVQSYLLEKDTSDDIDWQFDVVTVYIDMNRRISKVYLLEDIVL